MSRVIVLTPAPDFGEAWDWAYDVEAAALEANGLSVEARPWTEVGDVGAEDMVLPLVAWGYHEQAGHWHALLDRLEQSGAAVVNPLPVLRWNSDKAYLAELDAVGVPTVHTIAVDALDDDKLSQARARFGCDRLVVKPPISASATGTYLLQPGDPVPENVAGSRMLIQPFMHSISGHGEYSVMLFAGHFSHAILKTPKSGDFRVQPHLGGTERPCEAPDGAIELAKAALAAAPAEAVYARVDMVADDDGALRIMELELIEPALWLEHAPDGGASFGSAVLAAAPQK